LTTDLKEQNENKKKEVRCFTRIRRKPTSYGLCVLQEIQAQACAHGFDFFYDMSFINTDFNHY
jgi:hypothetical protein